MSFKLIENAVQQFHFSESSIQDCKGDLLYFEPKQAKKLSHWLHIWAHFLSLSHPSIFASYVHAMACRTIRSFMKRIQISTIRVSSLLSQMNQRI